jgi:hypothetical protein
MIAKITDCNCGNCTNEGCEYWEQRDKNFGTTTITSRGLEEQMSPSAFTIRKGCMLHPLAREALMANVVGELEKKVKFLRERAKMEENPKHSIWASGIEEAISRIRNGV